MQTHFMRRVGACASLPGLPQALVLLLVVLTMLVWAQGASAHASLIASTPMAGAVLPQAPATVRLTFNEPVSPLVLKIIQPDGSVKEIAQPEVLPAGLDVPLPALNQEGAYGLSWRVVSADGHPIGGTVTFFVGVKGASRNQETLATPGRSALIWLARLCGYIGLFFGIGLAVCRALTSVRGDKRRLAIALLALAAVATLLNAGLLGIDALDRPVSALLSTDPWRTAYSTSFGLSAVLALAALACAATVWYVATSTTRRLLAAMALMMLGASLAVSGHAGSAPPAWLARPAVWVHAIASGLFAGGFNGPKPAQTILQVDSGGLADAVSERRGPDLFAVQHAVGAVGDRLWAGSGTETRLAGRARGIRRL
jgi:copper transport protein